MHELLILLYFVFGTVIGSFLNVVVLRYYLEGTLNGRSKCFSCGKTLLWYEMVPLLSYVILRGHCSGCKSSISPQYILVELGTGILFAGLAIKGLVGIASIVPIVSLSLLVAIFVYDIRHKIVPDGLVYTFILLSFVSLFIDPSSFGVGLPELSHFFAGPVLFVPFFSIWFFSRGMWMGLGDGKLVLGMGWFLGLAKGLSAVALAFWIALIVITVLITIQYIFERRKKALPYSLSRKTEVPFTPFLITGFLISFYFEFDLALFIL